MQVDSNEDFEVKARIALKIWLEANNISVSMLARKLNANLSGVWKWYHGQFFPSLKVAIKLEQITEGVVACKLWMPTPIQSPTKKKVEKKHAKNTNKSESHDTEKQNKTSSKGRR